MCGIIGAVSKNNVLPLLMEGLKEEEYRGYDSCGVAYLNNKIEIKKCVGRVDVLNNLISNINSSLGIAHTRWATHGKNTIENAHPHQSNRHLFTLVHNGTIDNYKEIKEFLITKGYSFYSKTDTECIANLLEYEYALTLDVLATLLNAQTRLKGTYALAILFHNHHRIYFLKNEAPLSIGKLKDGYALSSDSYALINALEGFDIEDGEYGFIEKDNYKIFYNGEVRIPKFVALNHIQNKKQDIQKTYMEQEIEEIPLSLMRIVENYHKGIDKYQDLIKRYKKLVMIASGTSYHAALIIKNLFNKAIEVYFASEFYYLEEEINKDTLYVFISQSGETMDVLKALKYVKNKGGKTLSLTNKEGSLISKQTDYSLYLYAGKEVAVASTKAYCNEVALLYLLLGGKTYSIIEASKKCIISNSRKQELKDIAHEIKEANNAYFITRGKSYPLIMEASLKMKEITYIHSETLYAGELKHGPIALIENGFPVILISDKQSIDSLQHVREEVEARGAKTFLFTYETINPLEFLSLITEFFYLALYLALLRNKDVDKPRNLAKSVTVE